MKLLKDIGLNITEKEYRALEVLSYSVLSSLDREGPSSIGKEIKMTEPMLFGTIVDNMVDGSFDINDYHLTNGVDLGDGLKLAVEGFWEKHRLREDVNTDTELSGCEGHMTTFLDENEVDYYAKKAADWVAKKVCNDKAAQMYYKDLRMSMDKVVVTPDFMNSCTEAFNILKAHEFTKHLFDENVDMEDSAYQFKFVFTVKSHKFKGMLDRIIINHKEKLIKPYDLKTGGKPSTEFENSFFYWRYDLQALLYHVICLRIRKEYFPDYQIAPFKFIYIGRYDKKPLIWKTTMKHLIAASDGYVRNGKKYKGLMALIEEYDWYVLNSFTVDYPEEVYRNLGEVEISSNEIIINKKEKKK